VPELPDLTVYIEHLRKRLVGRRLLAVRLGSPFVLRTVEPAAEAFSGRTVVSITRIAKQIVIGFEDDFYLVMHLMVSGRLQWRDASGHVEKIPARIGLLALDFDAGTLVFTEASGKKRASLRLLLGQHALAALNPGGLEVFDITEDTFGRQLHASHHTLKRALTDQHVFAGIGNAYSDEILHRAGMSPFKLARTLAPADVSRLYAAVQAVLREWTDRLRGETGEKFPARVTAFHASMAVHGKYQQPCPVCGAPVQRIRYAENEANYCARCQTEGRVLADRSLSRLLKDDWPKRIEELE
jgi:formamidopyrimidine-DNA glycosylase